MILIEKRKLVDGTELEIQHIVKPHKPKMIMQIPATKRNYKGKNPSGGRKCFFTQSKEYKRKAEYGRRDHLLASGIWGVATEWGT